MAYETAILVSSAFISFTLIYAGLHIDKKHLPLQILFLFMGLLTIISTSTMGYHLAVDNTAPDGVINQTEKLIHLNLWTMYPFAAYIFVLIFAWALVFFARYAMVFIVIRQNLLKTQGLPT